MTKMQKKVRENLSFSTTNLCSFLFRLQYKKGASVNYISRNQALRKLQLTLADFR